MRLTRSLMIAMVAGATLWAQTTPKTAEAAKKPAPAVTAKKPASSGHSAVKPAAFKTSLAAAKVPAKQVARKPAAPIHHAPVAKPAVKPAVEKKEAAAPKDVAEKKVEPKRQEEEASKPEMIAQPASAKAETVSRVGARRDPFLSPIVRATGGGSSCEIGKRCLMVDQIQLKGIVKSQNGYIAVVENSMKRAYFLRLNDPVFNGSVIKITDNSVTFREETTDKLGKRTTRDVVKTVNAPVV